MPNMDAAAAGGLIVLDKPAGMSSAAAVAVVKKTMCARKAGHAGTLDPFATGLLICCLDQATKLSRFFLHGSKVYRATLVLGIETDTQDATGNVTMDHGTVSVSEPQARAACRSFEGRYWQTPPAYSALKHQGIPLYRYARNGKPVHKPPRPVEIDALRVLAVDLPRVQLEVRCSAGTYIRTLCADIGHKLGCGGHLAELRRLKSGPFDIGGSVSMEQLRRLAAEGHAQRVVVPMAAALPDLPEILADNVLTQWIKHGKVIRKSDLPPAVPQLREGFVKVVDGENNLIAVLGLAPNRERLKYHCVFNA
jgi:tRNA pseudouridine55 synthase